MFLRHLYFLSIDLANSCGNASLTSQSRIAAGVQVKAPIKLLIVYALRFIKVFVAKVELPLNAQKYLTAKVALHFYFCIKWIMKVAMRFYVHKILISKATLRFNTIKQIRGDKHAARKNFLRPANVLARPVLLNFLLPVQLLQCDIRSWATDWTTRVSHENHTNVQ